MAGLVADSLGLAPHWIYDTNQIESQFGRVNQMLKPSSDSYHHGQPLGGQTHTGHQTLVLWEALTKGIPFSEALHQFWQTSSSYKDRATKDFLAGSGGGSDELAGASRLSAVVGHFASLEEALPLVREQVLVTHSPKVADCAEKLTRVFYSLRSGNSVLSSLEKEFKGSAHLRKAQAVLHLEPVEAVARLGKDCKISSALPSVLYLLLVAKDYRESIIDNVMAGGDNAARGLILGSLLAARFGPESVPSEWLESLVFSI